MLDLIIRNAMLPDGRGPLDIGVQDGRIAVIATQLAAEAGRPCRPTANSSPRPSSTPTSIWTRRCPMGCRA
ncbi:cytosine deaminase domain protein [Bordetella holmesii 41130]|nr:cytosine deaminase domain protein [Bordetella holmesii 41130]